MRQYDRRQMRLPLESYADFGSVWHVTMAAHVRQTRLTNDGLAAALIDTLKSTCANARAPLLVYCLMPDHLHAVIQVTESDLISIIRNFKSFSTRIWWGRGGSGKLWQRSVHDRGIRQTEYMDDLIRYVFHNPVEAGDIEDWLERRLLGGTLIEVGS